MGSKVLELVHLKEPLLLGKGHELDDLLESSGSLYLLSNVDDILEALISSRITIKIRLHHQELGIMHIVGVVEDRGDFAVLNPGRE